MTISCWPLSGVSAVRSPGRSRLAVGRRRDRRQLAAEDLHALEEELDGGAVQAGHDGDRVVLRVEGHDRELVAGEADEHVDVVTGVDDGADARDLVDLDGHRPEAGRDVDDAAAGRRGVEVGGLELAVGDDRAGGRSGRRRGSAYWKAVVLRSASILRSWTVEHVGVTVVPSGMSLVAMTVGSTVGIGASAPSGGALSAAQEQGDAHKGNDRQEHPDEQDKPIRALQVRSPRVV